MTKDEVKTIITQMVQSVAGDKYMTDVKFKKMGIDSLDRIDLIYQVEKKFKIAIPDEVADKITRECLLIEAVSKIMGFN